jgi:hypothetical protein
MCYFDYIVIGPRFAQLALQSAAALTIGSSAPALSITLDQKPVRVSIIKVDFQKGTAVIETGVPFEVRLSLFSRDKKKLTIFEYIYRR